jgi:hypothetical protein
MLTQSFEKKFTLELDGVPCLIGIKGDTSPVSVDRISAPCTFRIICWRVV